MPRLIWSPIHEHGFLVFVLLWHACQPVLVGRTLFRSPFAIHLPIPAIEKKRPIHSLAWLDSHCWHPLFLRTVLSADLDIV